MDERALFAHHEGRARGRVAAWTRSRVDAQQRARLKEMGLGPAEVKRALDPFLSFHEQLAEEVGIYERLKRGDVGELRNLHGLGHMLIALRIARGLTQRELAERLGVHESQVSRDERNEYHGVTVQRASRILDALGVNLKSVFEQSVVGGSRPKRTAAGG